MKKTIIYLLIAAAASYGVRYFLHEGIRKNNSGVYGKFNAAFENENNYDVVFLGSSRAETHFDCRIFDSLNNSNSYNLGMEGASIILSHQILKTYLKKSRSPKHIILSIDHVFNYEKADTVFMYPRYFPYLHNDDLYQGLLSIDRRFRLFKFIPFYSMGHMDQKYFQASVYGYLGKKPDRDTGYYKGYFPFPDHIFAADKPKKYDAKPDPLIESYVDSISRLCKKVNARLHVVISPVYSENYSLTGGIDDNIKRLEDQSKQSGNTFYNFSRPDFSSDKSCFFDGFHLNRKGAQEFTRRFSVNFYNNSSK